MKEMPKFEPAAPESELGPIETFVGLKTQLDSIEDELSELRDKSVVSTAELQQFIIKRASVEAIKNTKEQNQEGDALLKYYRTMIKFRKSQDKKTNGGNGKKRKTA